MSQKYFKFLVHALIVSTTIVMATDSLVPEQALQEDTGIILFDETNRPIDLVYLPMNLKPYLHGLRACFEKEQSISQSLQDFFQALTDDFESIPKESAQQAIDEIVEILSHHQGLRVKIRLAS